MRNEFYGYLVSFMGILIASFVFLFGLAYWNEGLVLNEDDGAEVSTCVTSSGEAC